MVDNRIKIVLKTVGALLYCIFIVCIAIFAYISLGYSAGFGFAFLGLILTGLGLVALTFLLIYLYRQDTTVSEE